MGWKPSRKLEIIAGDHKRSFILNPIAQNIVTTQKTVIMQLLTNVCDCISNLLQSHCSELPGLSSQSMIRQTIPLVKWSTADPLDLIGSFLVANTNGLIPNTTSWTGWRQADEKHHFRHLKHSRKKTSVLAIAVGVAAMVGARWGIHDRVAHDKQFLLLPKGDLCLLTPVVSGYWFISTCSTSHRNGHTFPLQPQCSGVEGKWP